MGPPGPALAHWGTTRPGPFPGWGRTISPLVTPTHLFWQPPKLTAVGPNTGLWFNKQQATFPLGVQFQPTSLTPRTRRTFPLHLGHPHTFWALRHTLSFSPHKHLGDGTPLPQGGGSPLTLHRANFTRDPPFLPFYPRATFTRGGHTHYPFGALRNPPLHFFGQLLPQRPEAGIWPPRDTSPGHRFYWTLQPLGARFLGSPPGPYPGASPIQETRHFGRPFNGLWGRHPHPWSPINFSHAHGCAPQRPASLLSKRARTTSFSPRETGAYPLLEP